jgi:hypothetical protein
MRMSFESFWSCASSISRSNATRNSVGDAAHAATGCGVSFCAYAIL